MNQKKKKKGRQRQEWDTCGGEKTNKKNEIKEEKII